MKLLNNIFSILILSLIFVIVIIEGATTTTGSATGNAGTTTGTTTTGGPAVQFVQWDSPPQDITLATGSTILFVVNNNTGDHNVVSKAYPSTVTPFSSPILNFNKGSPSFTYTFTKPGNYLLVDELGENKGQMKLTIGNSSISESSEGINGTTTTSSSSSVTDSSSINPNSSSQHSSNSTTTDNSETTTSKPTTTATETPTGNIAPKVLVAINLINFLISITLLSIIL